MKRVVLTNSFCREQVIALKIIAIRDSPQTLMKSGIG